MKYFVSYTYLVEDAVSWSFDNAILAGADLESVTVQENLRMLEEQILEQIPKAPDVTILHVRIMSFQKLSDASPLAKFISSEQ